MNKSLAKAVSVIFHPGILPTYLFAYLGIAQYTTLIPISSPRTWAVLIAMVFFLTFLVPVLSAVIVLNSGLTPSRTSAKGFDFSLKERRDRTLPFLLTTVYYIAIAYFLAKNQTLGLVVSIIMGGLALSVLLTTILNFFYKVSAHAVGMSGILGLLLLISEIIEGTDFTYQIMALIVLLGAVMTARLALQAHDLWESLAGVAVGLISCYGILFFLIKDYF